jgi:hypothetical protein
MAPSNDHISREFKAMAPRSDDERREHLEAHSDRPEVQEEIRREIRAGKIRVIPGVDGKIRIIPSPGAGEPPTPPRP